MGIWKQEQINEAVEERHRGSVGEEEQGEGGEIAEVYSGHAQETGPESW